MIGTTYVCLVRRIALVVRVRSWDPLRMVGRCAIRIMGSGGGLLCRMERLAFKL